MNEPDRDVSPELPGLEVPEPQRGQLEEQAQKQIDALRAAGVLTDQHAARAELVLVTARDIDRSFGKGAPSGRANLLRVMNEILETLPKPETETSDELEAALRAVLDKHARP